MTHKPTTLVDILQWRAKHYPHQLAYRFLLDGEYDEVVLSYQDLDRRARSIAALLQSSVKVGDHALLLFPPGLDFIVAYLGCLYAKILAIPAYPPHPARIEISLPIIRRIVSDAGVAAVLLNTSLFDAINSRNAIRDEFSNMKLLVTDNDEMDFRAAQWQQPEIGSNDIAFLQYTSGSTTSPRGVMVSHSNLIHNLDLIEKCFGISKEGHGVIWLPPYHDMGLGGILQPIYSGIPFTLMPHLMFLQRPLRWLQTISRFRATISGGPNFAYDLCIRKIKPEQRELLDLSSWEIAFNGAEPIYYKTLDQFADYFASCGFRREAFVPCYGLAESTLLVVGGPKGRPPLIQHFLKKGLEKNQAIISPGRTEDTRTLVSCGQINSEQKVRIVNLKTLMQCQPNEIGEVWVSGPSVASGYWNKTAENEFTFAAQLSGNNDGSSYLRSGDVGFLHEGELYITGRLKSLIISEGKNHYPHDIERTVESSHSAIRPAGCAVFSIRNAECEDIIIVAELEHKLFVMAEEIIKAIREAVSLNHGLHVHDIRLTKPGDIPKTTSGKIRYFLCKKNYVASILKGIETS